MFKNLLCVCYLIASSIGFCFSTITLASEDDIETIYVSATRSETAKVPVATQIKVIDAEQIRVSGASTITEVLRTQAGIQIQDVDGSGGRNVTVSMRGFSANAGNNTLILVDGRKLNNPSLAGPALNTVALNDIERIEVIQGSAGVLYGDQAVGGVINVVTKRAKLGESKGSVSVQAGTGNLENYTTHFSQGFENGLNYSVGAQKRNADNYRDNNDSSITNVLGNIGFDFEGGRVFIESQKINDDLRLAGALSDAQADINPRKTNTSNAYSYQDTDLKRLGGDVAVADGWKIITEYADRDETGDYYFDFPGEKTTHYSMRVKNFSPRVVGKIKTANGDSILTVGYDGVKSDYESNNTYVPVASDQKVEGYYAQVVYPVLAKLTATLGSRYSSVNDVNHLTNKTNDKNLQASELGLHYQASNGWSVFSRYAESFRFANPDENTAVAPGIEFLKAQSGDSVDVGTAWKGEQASVSYSIYSMRVDDEILFDAFNFTNINLPKSTRKGFIFDGDIELSEQIALRANYTYTDAELRSGSFKGKNVPFIARDSGNLGVVFSFIQNLTLSFDTNYIGSRYLVGDDGNLKPKADAVTLFNATILWNFKGVELGARVKNITSERYSDSRSVYGQYPQPDRAYDAHLSYHF
jgi:iron complex outermembrane recepter protein